MKFRIQLESSFKGSLTHNEQPFTTEAPSITARFTSGWRPCCQKRRLLKLSININM